MNRERLNKLAWGAAFSTWVIGDIATTAYGLSQPQVVEASPTSQQVLESAGYSGMIATKLLVTAGFVGLQEITPEEYNIGVPLGLATIGTAVTLNNLNVIAKANVP